MVEPGGWWCTVKPKECGSDGDGGGGGAVGGDGGARCVRQKTWYVELLSEATTESPGSVLNVSEE